MQRLDTALIPKDHPDSHETHSSTLGCRTLKLGPGKHGQAGFCRAAAAMAAALILDSVRC